MTTHLVIADQDTLTRLLLEATVLLVADYPLPWRPIVTDVKAWKHRETGDTWLFRTPDARTDFESVEFAYCDRPEGYPGLRLVMPFKRWGESVLPLIAAADLLGVDEL